LTTSMCPPSPESGRSRARILPVGLTALMLGVLPMLLGLIGAAPASAAVAFPGTPIVRVAGNQLVDGSGSPIRLIGVDQSGTESSCVDGNGIFSPPNADTPSMIAAMKSWNINAVRLPLNEDCLLGINLPDPQFGGAAYQSAIVHYVNDLNADGLAVILDLHWGAPGTQRALGGEVMADEDHSPAFWSSVATTFRGHQGVVFDLFNEPRYLPTACLVNGGCTKDGVQVAGYNQLISDVRDTGATNVVMVAGSAFAANPTGFAKVMPYDPLGQLAISVHVYNFNAAKKPAAWAKWVHLGLLAKVPFVTGELGEKDCTATFIDSYMGWADANDVSYLAWAYNPGPCDGPFLLDPNGNPTTYGAGYKAHLGSLG